MTSEVYDYHLYTKKHQYVIFAGNIHTLLNAKSLLCIKYQKCERYMYIRENSNQKIDVVAAAARTNFSNSR